MQTSRRRLWVSLFALVLAGPVVAQTALPPLMIGDVGIFCRVPLSGKSEAPNTDQGTVDQFSETPRLGLQTTTIPAALDVGFGIQMRLAPGTPRTVVEVVVTHPPMAPTGRTEQSWTTELAADDWGVNLYRFDLPKEVLQGDWSIQVRTGDGTVLFNQPFKVVPPEQAPLGLSVCKGESLAS